MQPTLSARPTPLTRGMLWLHVSFFVFFVFLGSKHGNLHVDTLGCGPKPWTHNPESHGNGRAAHQVSCIIAWLELQLQGEPGHHIQPPGCTITGFCLKSNLLVPLATCNQAILHDIVVTVVPVII